MTPQTINWNRSTINGRAALSTVDSVASILGRYGLVIVIGWWPTARSWALQHLSRLHVLRALGVFELAAAVLIALKPIAPRLSIAGGVLAVVLFVSTISFLFTTPGVSEPARKPSMS